MDENLMNSTLEDNNVEDANIEDIDLLVEDVEYEIPTEEIVHDITVEPEEDVVIDISESMGWVSGDDRYHDSLLGIDFPRQHPIEAITNLREELDEIERLKTVYSDKFNVANYYKWKDAAYDTYGYFVSLVPGTSAIRLCDGSPILGVSINDAGFIGGQDAAVRRGNTYGLVATSGLVDVRCELDVVVGDCVVSNSSGYAKKSSSDYGYRVLARENKKGVEYAVILLGVQADVTNLLGTDLNVTKEQVDANYKNIITAINRANEAYNKAQEGGSISEEALKNALEAMKKADDAVGTTNSMSGTVSSTSQLAAQAKAIADSAAVSAASMRDDAVEKSKQALDETSALRDEFGTMKDGITAVENRISIVETEYGEYGTAIAGIQVDVDDHGAKINNLVSWQGDTNISMARIEKKADANGAYIQSTVSNMDKYAVGPCSQAYGFTLEQATSVLDVGMIYVPTKRVTEEYKLANEAIEIPKSGVREPSKVYYTISESEDGTKTTIYEYWDYIGTLNGEPVYSWKKSDIIPTRTRTFVPHYLYQWGRINAKGPYGWITVDKFYDPIKYDETPTNNVNTSAEAVYFTPEEPAVSGNFGYWYTNGDDVAEPYEPYTLYKWEQYKYEDGDADESDGEQTGYHWVAVATLAGNSQNRAVSQIRQDANSITAEIVDAYGSMAGFGAKLSETDSTARMVAAWKSGVEGDVSKIATIESKADANSASVSMVAANVGGCEKLVDEANRVEGKVYYDEDTKTFYYFKDGDWIPTADSNEAGVVINAASIVTSIVDDETSISLLAEKIQLEAEEIDLSGYVTIKSLGPDADPDDITEIDGARIKTGKIDAERINVNGDLSAFGATIGGWKINKNQISKDSTKLMTDDSVVDDSLVCGGVKMPIRLAVGATSELSETFEYEVWSEEGYIDEEIEFEYGIITSVQIISVKDTSGYAYRPTRVTIAEDGRSFVIYGEHLYGPETGEAIATLLIKYIKLADTTKSENEYNFRVLDDGSLYANAAEIKGTISADDGDIGGWDIGSNCIHKDSTYLFSQDDTLYPSVVTKGGMSQARFIVKESEPIKKYSTVIYSDSNRFVSYTHNVGSPVLWAQVEVIGTTSSYKWSDMTAVVDSNDKTQILITGESNVANASCRIEITYECIGPFSVLADGSLYASAAEIQASYNLTPGSSIGRWRTSSDVGTVFGCTPKVSSISNGVLYYYGMAFDANAANTDNDALVIGKIDSVTEDASARDWSMAAFSVTGNGHMRAESAQISGWSFDDSSLTKSITNNSEIIRGFYMSTDNLDTHNVVFGIGTLNNNNKANGNTEFYVDGMGEMRANGASFHDDVAVLNSLNSEVYIQLSALNGIGVFGKLYEHINTTTVNGLLVTTEYEYYPIIQFPCKGDIAFLITCHKKDSSEWFLGVKFGRVGGSGWITTLHSLGT